LRSSLPGTYEPNWGRGHNVSANHELESLPPSHWQELSIVIASIACGLLTMSLWHRFEKEFDGVQDVFELQVCDPFPSAILGYLER
jgi:hypothetical protein